MRYRSLILALSFLSAAASVKAQSLFDAVRIARPAIGTGTRSAAMGGSMIAAANDYSAIDWNPAALTLLEFNEFGFSLWNASHNSDAKFLGNTTSSDLNRTALYSIGLGTPIPTSRGHLAFAISYDRVQDYTTTYSFSAINTSSSFFNTKGFVQDPGFNGSYADYKSMLQYNLAWNLYLTHDIADSNRPKLTTPFTGNLLQSGVVTEEGGMHALRVGGGIDVAENVAFGATVSFLWGSYDYRRVYSETDINGVFNPNDSVPPAGFQHADIIDSRYTSQFGVGFKAGMLASPAEFMKIGFTFEVPTLYDVDDQFTRSGRSYFSSAAYDSHNYPQTEAIITNHYEIVTPMKFGGGVSFNKSGLTLAASAEYSDMSQLRFQHYAVDLGDLNDQARALLGGVLSWRVGGEYIIAPAKLSLRAGYRVDPSPYKSDGPEFDTKTISGGLGIVIGASSILEFSYQYQKYRTDHTIYNDLTVQGKPATAIINQDDVARHLVSISFAFRF
jgi:long-subunit fatty acid transport protein